MWSGLSGVWVTAVPSHREDGSRGNWPSGGGGTSDQLGARVAVMYLRPAQFTTSRVLVPTFSGCILVHLDIWGCCIRLRITRSSARGHCVRSRSGGFPDQRLEPGRMSPMSAHQRQLARRRDALPLDGACPTDAIGDPVPSPEAQPDPGTPDGVAVYALIRDDDDVSADELSE